MKKISFYCSKGVKSELGPLVQSILWDKIEASMTSNPSESGVAIFGLSKTDDPIYSQNVATLDKEGHVIDEFSVIASKVVDEEILIVVKTTTEKDKCKFRMFFEKEEVLDE